MKSLGMLILSLMIILSVGCSKINRRIVEFDESSERVSEASSYQVHRSYYPLYYHYFIPMVSPENQKKEMSLW